jgi:cobalt-zinc-cadmium efflux system protein
MHSHSAHGHNHATDHAPARFGKAFAIGTALNIGFIILEVAYGLISNSTALLADAGHNVSDVFGLLVAWAASILAARSPNERYTYGLRSASILAALFNAMFLLVAVGAIGWESVQRIQHPQPVASITIMFVAGAGIVINGATALLFMSGRKSDINIEGAFLHMAADAAVSLGVVVAAGLMMLTGLLWLDPAASLLICVVILWSTWGLLRRSLRMSLSAVPESIDLKAVKDFLASRPGVSEVHDLHIWPISTTTTALTAHLVMPTGAPGDDFLHRSVEELHKRFSIEHATLQIEKDGSHCRLAPDDVV